MTSSKLNITLGIDFGTSLTKICIRADDTERSEVVSFGLPDIDYAFLVSKIGIRGDGTLLAGLTTSEWENQQSTIQTEVNFIKMRLANIDLPQESILFEFERLPQYTENIDLNDPQHIENFCIYFLAKVIARAKEWFRDQYPDRIKNKELDWSVNIGVPVQYYDSPSLLCFQNVLRHALLLSDNLPIPDLMRFDELAITIISLHDGINSNMPCFAIPEVAAGAFFYTNNRVARPGDYLYVDIGSGTVEFCSFSFRRENGSPQVSAIKAFTPPIGVDSLIDGVLRESNASSSDEVRNIVLSDNLINEISDLIGRIGISPQTGESIATIAKREYLSIMSGEDINFVPSLRISQEAIARVKANRTAREQVLLEIMLWQRAIHLLTSIVPAQTIFLGGGGRESEIYRYSIEATYSAFQWYRAGGSPINIQDIIMQESSDFTMNGIPTNYSHRFAIAFGLSIPEYEMPEFQLPSSSSSQTSSLRIQPSIQKIIQAINSPRQSATLSLERDWRESPNIGIGRISN